MPWFARRLRGWPVAIDRDALLAGTERALKPPPKLSLSEWADRYFYLSPESAAEPGRWRTLPYQKAIMDAITDPAVERVSFMKSARVGATKIMNAAIGYYMHQDPCPIMVVQPTVEDAGGYSKEEIAPMLRDCDVLSAVIEEPTAKKSSNTILHKTFPGGSLSMVGANSARGFRRVSRRIIIFDEVDGYPASAGSEGDQIKLGIKRSEYYWNRKIIAASTPLIAGTSRIEDMFLAGDQRRYHVPCPHCGHRDILTFREQAERGHWLAWEKDRPETAHFVCRKSGCIIEHQHKREMLEQGEWIADAQFHGHASFHIWAAYSMSPNATWEQIAAEFLDAKDNPKKLQTVINTLIGETWQVRGEAPDWERLYLRREKRTPGLVPEGVEFLTCGVDVQKDRFVYSVKGWALNKENWAIEPGVLYGDTSDPATWSKLSELLDRQFPSEDGRMFPIRMMAVDSGYNTQMVYNWCRRYPMGRVIAVKGVGKASTLIGMASPVDITVSGRRASRGYKVWPVGVSIAKAELYGWLRLPLPVDGESPPAGWCHFSEVDPEYFRQITAEQQVETRNSKGFTIREWQVLPGRENHWLDCEVYNRAAAAVLGIDRVQVPSTSSTSSTQTKSQPVEQPTPNRDDDRAPRRKPSFLDGRNRRGRSWLDRKR